MKINRTLSLNTDQDKDILARIEWLDKNKKGSVAAWMRDMIRAGMRGESEIERRLERIESKIDKLAASGVAVTASASEPELERDRIFALDKLGL